jgi:hypothetical protein
MANKQLNNRIKQLESELVDLKINKHKSDYIHIPKPNGLWFGKFFAFIFLAFLSVMNFLLIKAIWLKFNLGYVFATEEEWVNYTIEGFHLIVLYPLVGEYLFIALTIFTFVSLFKKLKSFDEAGLIVCLIFGLIFGLIVCLIFGLIVGLIFGLIVCLILGLIFGLIVCLIIGLIVGLPEEFN